MNNYNLTNNEYINSKNSKYDKIKKSKIAPNGGDSVINKDKNNLFKSLKTFSNENIPKSSHVSNSYSFLNNNSTTTATTTSTTTPNLPRQNSQQNQSQKIFTSHSSKNFKENQTSSHPISFIKQSDSHSILNKEIVLSPYSTEKYLDSNFNKDLVSGKFPAVNSTIAPYTKNESTNQNSFTSFNESYRNSSVSSLPIMNQGPNTRANLYDRNRYMSNTKNNLVNMNNNSIYENFKKNEEKLKKNYEDILDNDEMNGLPPFSLPINMNFDDDNWLKMQNRRYSSSNAYKKNFRQRRLMNVSRTVREFKIKDFETESTDKTILENHGIRVKYEDYTTIGNFIFFFF